MYDLLIYAFIIISLLLILIILFQPSKQQDALSLLASDKGSKLFETQKPYGKAYFLQYITVQLGIIWLILGIVLMYLGNH